MSAEKKTDKRARQKAAARAVSGSGVRLTAASRFGASAAQQAHQFRLQRREGARATELRG